MFNFTSNCDTEILIVKYNAQQIFTMAKYADVQACCEVLEYPFDCCSKKFVEHLYNLACEGKKEEVTRKMYTFYTTRKETF